MKILFYSLLFLPCFVFAQTTGRQMQITVANPLKQSREDELVVITRKQLQAKLGAIKKSEYVDLKSKGLPVPVQFDDLDKDGTWDELVFLYSFKGNEKAVFIVCKSTEATTAEIAQRAHVRQRRKNADASFGKALERDSIPAGQPNTDFGKQALPPFLTEGPAWENDKVGFRIYMDIRNTKDIWGKLTPAMMMDTVGADPKSNYHHLSTWGMDILAVGKSLGAGSLALQVPRDGQKDTLIRLGGANMGPVIYEKVSDGPLRAIFRMHYPEWQVLEGLPPVSLTEEISIWGGHYFYQSKVTARNLPQDAKLLTGIVNLKSKSAETIGSGKAKALVTFAPQSENNDNLGLAIATPNGNNASFGEAPKEGNADVQSTYTVAVPIVNNTPVPFRFYSCWEKSDRAFITKEGFDKYLTDELQKYSSELIIK